MNLQKTIHWSAPRCTHSNAQCHRGRAIRYKSVHTQTQHTSGFPLLSLADGTYNSLSLLLILSLSTISSPSFAQKTLSYTEKSYEVQIKTVQLYPDLGGTRDYLQPAATSIQQQTMLLEFDDLQDHRDNYYVKLIHCNYDWTKSTLNDLDFLENYNENPITDYAFSINTHTRYIHYRYQVPHVKIPGNYLLIVYRNDRSDIILSKRMMIFHNQIALSKDNLFIGSGTLQRGKQQFNFDLDYSSIEILNPMENMHVTIRQNQRWDNAKINLPPSFIRDSQSQMEYRFLDADKQFDGGNEFRFVDFRSLNYPGQNTGKLNRTVKPYELYVAIDGQRSEQAYSQYLDLDGNYLIENLDVGEASLTGNYLYVNFILKSPPIANADVYVVGSFNNYQRSEENKMIQNTEGYYESRQFLKQGLYNYQYVVDSPKTSATAIEGTHFETENVYEVLIYNRPFRPNADLLLGYYLIPVNPR
ncbi:MAG: type IX secretion system plug protein domain-containing protein [Cyclobacteriaceae bacterium]